MELNVQNINCEYFFQDMIQLTNKNCDSNILLTLIEENKLPDIMTINSSNFKHIFQSLVLLASKISNDKNIIISTSYYGNVLRVEIKFHFINSSEKIDAKWIKRLKQSNTQYKHLSKLILELGSRLILFINNDLSGYFRIYLRNQSLMEIN